MKRYAVLVMGALLAIGIVACGTPSLGGNGRGGADSGSGQPVGPSAGPSPAVVKPQAGDRQVPFTPTTYPADNPCAAQATTVPVPKATAACGQLWSELPESYIPGVDAVTASPTPHTVTAAAGIDPASAAATATAYYRQTALTYWAATHPGGVDVIAALDTRSYESTDPLLATLRGGGYIGTVPNCIWPTALRVASVDAAARRYLQGQGWKSPSSTAVVVTVSQCSGFTVQYQDGTNKQLFGYPSNRSIVLSGSIQTIPPYGEVWVVDGVGTCGAAELASPCGG